MNTKTMNKHTLDPVGIRLLLQGRTTESLDNISEEWLNREPIESTFETKEEWLDRKAVVLPIIIGIKLERYGKEEAF